MELGKNGYEPKKIKYSDFGKLDFISTLPDDMLLRILSYTTCNYYKEVVKCSILSKRWRHLYTMSPALHFVDGEVIGKPYQNLKVNERRNLMERAISSALFRHKADVRDFVLQVYDMSQWNWCLQFVSNYAITHLDLDSYKPSMLDEFPFSCENIMNMNLSFIECVPRSCHLGFPQLGHCRLWLFMYNQFWYREFLRNCPVLEFLSFTAPFSPQLSPFTFSSPSIDYLDIRIHTSENDESADGTQDEIEIIVEGPRLRRLRLHCLSSYFQLKVKVDAPNLDHIYVSSDSDDERVPSIQCNQISWGAVLLKEATWNTGRDLTYLNIEGFPRYKLLELGDIHPYSTLRCLKLSRFMIRPIKFWEMLSHHLPLLESLTLSDCSFEHDSFDVSREEDVQFDISGMNRKGYIVYKKKIKKEIGESALAEVSIIMDEPLEHGLHVFSGAEREMLHHFWLKAKYLKRLTISFVKQQQLSKANYLRFFWHLVSEGESVNLIKETHSKLVFQLIKADQEEISVSV